MLETRGMMGDIRGECGRGNRRGCGMDSVLKTGEVWRC